MHNVLLNFYNLIIIFALIIVKRIYLIYNIDKLDIKETAMTIEQVETFLTVINCGNTSAAADRLFVSQSTVSNRIQSLE